MAIVGLITLIVAIAGLVIYLLCAGISKGSFAEVGKILFFAGMLAFLFSVSAQSCSVGTAQPAAVHSH